MAAYDPMSDEEADPGMKGVGLFLGITAGIIFLVGFSLGSLFGSVVL